MRGFKINTDSMGGLSMSYDQEDTILGDIIMSVTVRRGSFFLDPNFGLRELPKKRTEQNIELIKDYYEEALRWLLLSGKAKSIDVRTEPWDLHRVKIFIEVKQSNDQVVEYATFAEVV